MRELMSEQPPSPS